MDYTNLRQKFVKSIEDNHSSHAFWGRGIGATTALIDGLLRKICSRSIRFIGTIIQLYAHSSKEIQNTAFNFGDQASKIDGMKINSGGGNLMKLTYYDIESRIYIATERGQLRGINTNYIAIDGVNRFRKDDLKDLTKSFNRLSFVDGLYMTSGIDFSTNIIATRKTFSSVWVSHIERP